MPGCLGRPGRTGPDTDQHIALARRQAADRSPHRGQPVPVIQAAGQLISEVGHNERRVRQAAERRLVPAGRAGLVAGHVDRDAKQPRPQGSIVEPDSLPQPPGFQVREGDHFLGGGQLPVSPAAYRYTACT